MIDATVLARICLSIGLFFLITGALFYVGGKFFSLGNLPGDFTWKRDNITVYIPLATSLLISLILTVILNLFYRK